MKFTVNQIIKPIKGCEHKYIDELVRILFIDESMDKLIVIPIKRKESNKRKYFRRYKVLKLNEVEALLNSSKPSIQLIDATPRKIQLFTDSNIISHFKYPSYEESKALNLRDDAWNLIHPLVFDQNYNFLFEPNDLNDKVYEYAESLEFEIAIDTLTRKIKNALYQYWALGSQKNSLLPFIENCGCKGKEKTSSQNSLGNKNVATRNGDESAHCLAMTMDHKEYIKHAWTHFLIRGVTVRSAYRKFIREFYSKFTTDTDGSVTISEEEFLPNQKPTYTQFKYWGEKLTQKTASFKQGAPNQFVHKERALPGKANQAVNAVGQYVAIDSTTTDTYLCSYSNRLKTIGFANRVLLVDMKHGYIAGFYMGIRASSSKTVKLALLHALSDKSNWLKHLGIHDKCPAEDWLRIKFNIGFADNTEARSKEIFEDVIETGIIQQIQFIPTNRSDCNSMVETAHKVLHRLSDHKLLGTTRGKQKQRSEPDPSIGPKMNLMEATRATAIAIHTHNTQELDPSVLTLEMKEAGIKPTRLDMTNYDLANGRRAVSLMSIEEARLLLLPRYAGVFTKSGVRLFRNDRGEKAEYISRLNYVSKNKHVIDLMAYARVKGNYRTEFRVDPFNINSIWYLHLDSGELIELELQTNDLDLANECTLYDLHELRDEEALERFYSSQKNEEKISDLEQDIENISHKVKNEYQQELSELNEKPSKSSLKKDKKENRINENDGLLNGMPTAFSNGPVSNASNDDLVDDEKDEDEVGGDEVDEDEVEINLIDQALGLNNEKKL